MQDVTLSDGTTVEIHDRGDNGFKFVWRSHEFETLAEGILKDGSIRVLEGEAVSLEAVTKVMAAAAKTDHRIHVQKVG